MQHKIFTADLLKKLLANGIATRAAQTADQDEPDHFPVLKVFNPTGAATWLLTELDEDGDTLFGLCDLGMQCAELGSVSKTELETTRGRMGLPMERDAWFKAKFPLSVYTEAANAKDRITESTADLTAAALRLMYRNERTLENETH